MPPLSKKTALITGAAAPQGIGRAIALKLAALGADFVVTDIAGALDLEGARYDRLTLLEALAADLRAAGGRAMALPLDVTDPADVQSAVTRTLSDFGRLDILVNNAGSLAGSDAFLSTTPAQWEASFRVNLLGPMMLSQAAIPAMQALGGGRIIMIGSTGSLGAEAGFGAYTAMKHGLVGLAKTLAAEFGKDGILCNTVCPGYIATDMHQAANARLAQETGLPIGQIKAQRYAAVPLGDAGTPEDVANGVAFLASDQARYVTGINLPVTGGVAFGI
jgi:3-oxoacyl-[acyl-carrier protein] reductase